MIKIDRAGKRPGKKARQTAREEGRGRSQGVAGFDLLLRGGVIAGPDGEAEADIGVRQGRIVQIGPPAGSGAARVLDLRGLHILPGVLDTQVHFREPGAPEAEQAENLETGSRAAVMGGVTGVFEMPNTNPPTTTPAALKDKLRRAQTRMFCDFAFYAGGIEDNADNLAQLEQMPGCCGIKVFMGSSTGTLLAAEDPQIARILAALSRRAAFHAEDEARLQARRAYAQPGRPETHPRWRDAASAARATRRLLHLARRAGRKIHVLHVSTAGELALLARAKAFASVEATPQHLTLAAPACYQRLGTRAQMNPPIRGPRHRRALWAAIRSGIVDVIGSDHAPHSLAAKARPYPNSPAGMPGVQTLVPLMLDHVNRGRLSLARLCQLTSANPARLFAIAGKGRIAPGFDADFTIVDLKARRRIEDGWIESLCGWTPFHGTEVQGWPAATIIRGQTVMWQGEIAPQAAGRPIRFA